MLAYHITRAQRRLELGTSRSRGDRSTTGPQAPNMFKVKYKDAKPENLCHRPGDLFFSSIWSSFGTYTDRKQNSFNYHIKITIIFILFQIVFYKPIFFSFFVNLRISYAFCFPYDTNARHSDFSLLNSRGESDISVWIFFLFHFPRHIFFLHPCQKLAFHPHYLRRNWKKMGVCATNSENSHF